MNYRVPRLIIGVCVLATFTACSNVKQLKEDNLVLRQQVEGLEQIHADYSDKLARYERQSHADKGVSEKELETLRRSLETQIANKIDENQALIQKLNSLTIITIGEAALFASGKVDLTPSGVEIISKLSNSLGDYPGYNVRIEGHSDSLPISSDLKALYPSNWELSGARASTVARYMIYGLGMAPERLSVAGFAHYRPIADNETAQGRADNRRIRLVVYKSL